MRMPKMHPLLLLSTISLSAALSIPPQFHFQLPFNRLQSNTHPNSNNNHQEPEKCPQPSTSLLQNSKDGLHPSIDFLEDPSIHAMQVHRLAKAVQVPTTVTDFMTDPFDEGFDVFVEFQAVLRELFPVVHNQMHLEKVNRLGLLYTLPGTNPSLKPILFMAHQDVVPITSASDWTHPPFSGYYNSTDDFLWGRGSSDCKNVLVGVLSVLEDLLSQGFVPNRTIVLAFGFDEESHGFLGAGSLAEVLEERYGNVNVNNGDKNGVEMILDEGGMGVQSLGNAVYALPGVGEKGAIDLVIEVDVPGGHSSVPPSHTGIGILAEIIYLLEREDLFEPFLGEDHPKRQVLECQARYSSGDVEEWLDSALRDADMTRAAEKIAVSRGEKMRFILQTSQAADMISGGVKTNALPEKASAIVNYRVALHQDTDDVVERAVGIIEDVATRQNLTFSHPSSSDGGGGGGGAPKQNHITLYPLTTPLSPSPVSPTSLSSATWRRFSSLARGVFETVFPGKTVVVAGDIMTGNTDTRFYWNLSRNIYRWSPTIEGGSMNIHTVDERMSMRAHLVGMMVYYDLIRGFDVEDS